MSNFSHATTSDGRTAIVLLLDWPRTMTAFAVFRRTGGLLTVFGSDGSIQEQST